MELDHTNLGHNCEFPDCNQRDFLPFTCDLCRRKLCLAHRSYNAHACEGSNSKDMTSIDCPICGKGVKFSLSQSADQIWEDHYNTKCSRQVAAPQNIKKCSKLTCTTVLGLSNSFRCLKCSKEVCLSHRNPEEHDCISLKGSKNSANSAFLDSLVGRNGRQEPKSNPTPSVALKNKSNGTKSSTDQKDNSLRGTAGRRMEGTNNRHTSGSSGSSNQNAEQFSCPMCGFISNDALSLQNHFTATHDTPSSSTSQQRSIGAEVDNITDNYSVLASAESLTCFTQENLQLHFRLSDHFFLLIPILKNKFVFTIPDLSSLQCVIQRCRVFGGALREEPPLQGD